MRLLALHDQHGDYIGDGSDEWRERMKNAASG